MSSPVSRRGFLKGTGAALSFAALDLGRFATVAFTPPFDLVIRNGLVLDGTGGPAFEADIGIRGDTIAAVGRIAAEQGGATLDAKGLALSPGFIDIHTHSDGGIFETPTAESRVYQGITTEVTGNCGSCEAPLLKAADTRPNWATMAEYLEALETLKPSLNHAALMGQGTLRREIAGREDRALTAAELATVLRLTEEGMADGAFGLSTGLEYIPGRYTPTDEIVAMARVVARYGGFYASHIRNEEATLLEAVDECFDIGRSSGVRVQLSHLKACGRPNWRKQRAALDLLEQARRAGLDAWADAYPYTAYSTTLTIFLDRWALEGNRDEMVARLKDPSQRARIRKELLPRVASDPGGYDLIVIASLGTAANQRFVGKSIAAAAAEWGIEAPDALLRFLEEERGGVSFIGHAMSPENVETVLAHPLVMFGSDGSSQGYDEHDSRPHPRSFGAAPRLLGHYARDRKLFDLPTAVKKMTGMPAQQIGLADRGRIARGKKADLVLFDPKTIADGATFDEPRKRPTGIPHVLVNGVFVVKDDAHTGARPGRALRR